MDTLAVFLSSDSEEENIPLIRRKLRDKSNILEIPNEMFTKIFRLSKESFVDILDKIQDKFKQSLRITHIPPILKLGITLRFLAEGNYQTGVGQDFLAPMCQATVCRVLEEVTTILEENLCPQTISFILSEREKLEGKKHFFQISGFPGVIGAIDGTHVKIIRPRQLEHLYFGRKGYHTLNVMVICDHTMKIRAVNPRHGGASHDSSIWSSSDERAYLESNYMNGDKCCILGSNKTNIRSCTFVCTPYESPVMPVMSWAVRTPAQNSVYCFTCNKAICAEDSALLHRCQTCSATLAEHAEE